ncbi:MAG: preprotein translocase subunit YajC [Gammaproteobacteria bacterium]|jgi:preprotein translocase subunit YajC|nr:preprotein translocase subunit YajC [Gammaproteobacteria bacterium]PKO36403.1 MAG: preprotein translocase subunit YajC [Betaproteobacteria bacterium HGW-Betaproteobacteria-6]PKO46260.1 MAG: preprotein translocase subunit YajC [Betaproteobacteria bacterium HGW-Betaproteobacteria-4]MBU1601268.1 preprotein translocase subunit YajC [Gammaproteobacteria bacterium]MBU2433849.1 preprotein translocase subunit YajC [Gammaproteobacteria bacterium]
MISLAHAQTAAASADPTGGLMQMLPMILMFVVLWFFMIRPQMKKAKEHKALLAALAKGDEVVTQGGIVGKVTKVGDSYVTVEIAEGTEVVVQKPSIGLVLPKGTLKSL